MADENDKSGLARRMQLRQAAQNLEKAQSQTKKRQKDYADVLINHLRDNGQIICVTEDMALSGQIKEIISETLKMPASCASFSAKADLAGKAIRSAVTAGRTPLVIIEQFLGGRDLTFVVRTLKNTFPEIKLIMIAQEIDKNRFVLLHESGVDSMLVKPADGAAILEKIARTIKPDDQAERALDMARVLLNKGELENALRVCTQEIARSGNSAASLMLAGDIFKAMREWDKAADAYNRASGGSSLFLEPLRKLSELYAEKGDMARQLEYLEKMDELSPLNLERKILIGELALKLKRGDKARKIFDQVMKLSARRANEGIASVAYRVADIYTDTDPDMAASFLQRGLE
ncbi:MAG: histidine kinase, partial [Desulfovibrio sp.]|nr:histidine kinase [Desulfovibrio sp.]